MTTWQLVEGAVEAVREYFIENFDEKLLEIQAEKSDNIELGPLFQVDGVPQWHTSEKSLASLQAFPVGFVLGGDSEVGFWNNRNVEGTHEITLSVMVSDQEPTNLRLKMYRTQRALWETLVAAYYANALTGYKIVGSPQLSISPTVTDNSRYLGEARVIFNVVNQERRS